MTPKLTKAQLDELSLQKNILLKEHPEQRDGQALFNALFVMNRALASEVVGETAIDPFYDDLKINAFLTYISEH